MSRTLLRLGAGGLALGLVGLAWGPLNSSWRRFSSYPCLAKGYAAMRQGQPRQAEAAARHVLQHLDPAGSAAQHLLAEALVKQRRFAEALPLVPANRDSSSTRLRSEIQHTWLNQAQPVPAALIGSWLRQAPNPTERDQLAQAYAEQLRRLGGPRPAWTWLKQQPMGPASRLAPEHRAYRSGLAELTGDWRGVLAELNPLTGRSPLPDLLRRRLALALASLRPQRPAPAQRLNPMQSLGQGEAQIPAGSPGGPSAWTADLASYRLITAGKPRQALALLERAVETSRGPLAEPLASRLINLYASFGPPSRDRLAALAPRLAANLRGSFYESLVAQGHCNLLPPPPEPTASPVAAGEWLARGECSLAQRPGEAAVYLQRASDLGLARSRSLLGFALAAAGEPEGAYQIWTALPQAEQQNGAVQTGMAQVSLEVGAAQRAEQHWQTIARPTPDQWRLGALIAQAQADPATALVRFERVLASSSEGADFYQAGLLARQLEHRPQALVWLKRATDLSPGNGRYLSDYGFTLAGDPAPGVRAQAIPALLQASRSLSSNPAIEAELASRYREQGNRPAALQHLGRAIDLESDPASASQPTSLPDQRQRLYGLKRTYEALARQDAWLINATWSPDGVAQTINEALLNANNTGVGTVLYEHRLGRDGLFGDGLFGYGRLISANDAANSEGQHAGGLGLRWAPIRGLNMNLFGEAYQGTLGQVSSTDLLLRINGSFLDQGHWNAEWKENRQAWNERSLYVDAAWFVGQNQVLSLLRYSQGRSFKLPGSRAQTLSPYAFVQGTQQNALADLRLGLGLRWQWWLDQDQHRAYRRKLTGRAELQQSLAGDLYSRSTGVVLSLQADL